jgi:ABC-type Fe3+ transport system permease subunit
LWGWFFISVILPALVLIVQAFQNGISHFVRALDLLAPTFVNSIILAVSGALLIVFTGFAVACFTEVEKRRSLIWFLLIIFAIPSTVFGISLIKFYNRPALDFIYSGYFIILIGYTGKFSFISAKLIGNAIGQLPASLDEAAQLEGISRYRRIRNILIPLTAPALFAAFTVSFIFCLGELGTTIMVYPPGTGIMPVKVFTVMANAPQAVTSSMTLIVFSVTLLMITVFYLVSKYMFGHNINVYD